MMNALCVRELTATSTVTAGMLQCVPENEQHDREHKESNAKAPGLHLLLL